MIDPRIWTGVNALLDNYCRVQTSDYFVVVYNSDTKRAASDICAALALRGAEYRRVWMIPLVDPGFRSRFKDALPQDPTLLGRLVVLTLELSTMSHDDIIKDELKRFGDDNVFLYRVISTCDELFERTIRTPPEEISECNAYLLDRMMLAKKLRIVTDGGSDLAITLDSEKHRWVSNRGVRRAGSAVILPAGEVATFPDTIEGIFVADFAFNVNMMTDCDARLNEHPVKVEIVGNRAVRYACADETIYAFLDECFSTFCSHIVGELGFGTNGNVWQPIALNSHINERHPGIHLGFGSSNQAPSVVGYNCDIHLDLIARGGLVWIDDEPDPINLSALAKSNKPHPVTTRDEDASSGGVLCDLEVDDCCGILTSKGIQLFPVT